MAKLYFEKKLKNDRRDLTLLMMELLKDHLYIMTKGGLVFKAQINFKDDDYAKELFNCSIEKQ